MFQLALFILAACTGQEKLPPPPVDTDAGGSTAPDTETAPDTDTDAPPDTGIDTGATSPDLGEPVVLVVRYQSTCAAPEDRATLGPFYLPEQTEWEDRQPRDQRPEETAYAGQGAAVADFDGDGLLDIYLPSVSPDQLYLQGGDGLFHDRSGELLPKSADDGVGAGATAVDVEGDGDLDLYVATIGGPDLLLINDGEGRFTDGTAAAGFGEHGGASMGSTWADFDGDGDLDPWVVLYGSWLLEFMEDDTDLLERTSAAPHRPFFRNRGDGTFEDLSDWLPLDALRRRFSFAAGWYDMVGDSRPELYLSADYRPEMEGEGNMLFTISDGELVDISGATATDILTNAMGMSRGDVNSDGRPDIFMSGISEFSLMTSLDDESWYDAALSRSLTSATEPGFEGWGTALVDLDHDGDLDAYSTCGFVLPDLHSLFPDSVTYDTYQDRDKLPEPSPMEQLDRLWIQDEAGLFIEEPVDSAWGLHEVEQARTVIFADFNQDGWLDILRRYMDRPATIHYARCGSGGWLEVELRDAGSPNPFAVGARIELTVDGETQTRWIDAGSTGIGSGVPLSAHFGLGEASQIDQLIIHWPDGLSSTLTDLDVNQAVTIERQRE